MALSHPFVLILSIILTSLILTATHAVDPTCATGLHKNHACCPTACGTCGGQGCFRRSGSLGTRCCPSGINNAANNVPSCNMANPPCRITSTSTDATAPVPQTNTTPVSSSTTVPSSATSGTWRTSPVRSGLPVNRHEACSAMVNGQLVLLGGRGVNKPTSIYNPRTKVWRTASGPGRGEQLHHLQCVVAAGSVWAVASWKGFFPNEVNNDAVFEYHVTTDTWRKHPGMPADRNRGGAAAVRRGDLIFVIAGNRGGHGAHAESLPWVDAFNWKTKTWVQRNYADMPDAGRDHVGAALVNDEICVAGGRNGGADKFFKANIASVYCYDFARDSWSRKQNMPTPRAGANTALTCDGRMMVAGGEGNNRAYDRVDVFDGRRWQQGPALVAGRHSSGLAFAKCDRCGHAFIPSGSGGQGGGPELATTEEYIPTGAPADCAMY